MIAPESCMPVAMVLAFSAFTALHYCPAPLSECAWVTNKMVRESFVSEMKRDSSYRDAEALVIFSHYRQASAMLPSIANSLLSDAVNNILQENQERNRVKKELKREIRHVRQERRGAVIAHKKHMKQLRKQLVTLEEKIKTARSNELPMYRYASELKDSETPTHILLLQAQLCRAVHYMSVDAAQLQMMERTKESLVLLTQGQEGIQLNRVLWAVEAKVELQQQHHEAQESGEVVCVTNESNLVDTHDESRLVNADMVDSLLGLNVHGKLETCNMDDAEKNAEPIDESVFPTATNVCVANETEEEANAQTSRDSQQTSENNIHTNYFLNTDARHPLEESEDDLHVSEIDNLVDNITKQIEEEDSRDDSMKASLFDNVSTWNSPQNNDFSDEDDWQEITVEDLKKSNLDELLCDGEDTEQETFHVSLPTIREQRGDGKVAMNRRGSMIAEGCYSEKLDAEWR